MGIVSIGGAEVLGLTESTGPEAQMMQAVGQWL